MDVGSSTQLLIVKGLLRSIPNVTDKALTIEKEMGMESLYTLISMGELVGDMAISLGLSAFEMEFILKRTPNHRKQYLNAKTLALAESSMDILEHHSGAFSMEKEEAASAKHHSNMLDKSLKIVNAPTEDAGTGNITVNNTVVVRSGDDIPELPPELRNVIEGEII